MIAATIHYLLSKHQTKKVRLNIDPPTYTRQLNPNVRSTNISPPHDTPHLETFTTQLNSQVRSSYVSCPRAHIFYDEKRMGSRTPTPTRATNDKFKRNQLPPQISPQAPNTASATGKYLFFELFLVYVTGPWICLVLKVFWTV